MKRTLAYLMLGLTAGSPALFPGAAAEDEDTKLAAFFKNYLDEHFRRHPFDATRLGDHRFDHLLDDLSPKARAASVLWTRQVLQELPRQVDYQKLSRSGQIDFEIFQHHLTYLVWQAERFRPFEEDPRVYNEYISDSVFLLLTQSTLEKRVNLTNAAERMAHIPRIVEAAKANLKNPPRVYVETAIKQNRGSIFFYEGGIFEVAGETATSSELKAPAAKVVAALKD
jgi:hypothetical protein